MAGDSLAQAGVTLSVVESVFPIAVIISTVVVSIGMVWYNVHAYQEYIYTITIVGLCHIFFSKSTLIECHG